MPMSDRHVFIGPAKSSWLTYQIARRWVAFRMAHPMIRHVPGVDRITSRALDVTLGSRDVKVVEGDADV